MNKCAIFFLGILIVKGQFAWPTGGSVDLGDASLSLNVKDINISKSFYEKLGFRKISGDISQKWLLLQHETNHSVIGIFQGHFKERFLITYNPTDLRNVQRQLKKSGIIFEEEAEGGTGPAHAVLNDPDGNVILLDQFN